MGKLAAYLMMPSRHKFNLQHHISVRPSQTHIAQPCNLGIPPGSPGTADERLVLALVTPKHILQKSLGRIRLGTHHGPIEFVHLRVTEHRVQAFECLGCLRKHCYSAHRAVKTMRQAEKDLSGLGIPHCNECLVRIRQRLVTGLVPLHNLADFLIDYKQVIVLIQYPRGEVGKFSCRKFTIYHIRIISLL